MSRSILGIEIRNHSIIAVLVKSSVRDIRIDDYAKIPIPAATEETQNGLPVALEALTQTIDISGCDCVISVPSDRFSYRNIRVPFSNRKKIRMVLPFELEPTLPYRIEDLILDFQTIETPLSDENTSLIAAAVEKSQMEPYLEALTAIKMDPECVTISGLPAALCLAAQSDLGEDQLFIDIQERSSTLFASVAGKIQLIRSFPLPPSASTRSKMLGTQIRRTLAAFEEMQLPEFHPNDIFVSGKNLEDTNLAEDIAGAFNTTVQEPNLAQRLAIPIEVHAENSWNPARMDNALALALMVIDNHEGLNFHRSQFAVQKFLAKNKPQVVRTAILAAAVLALMVFNVAVDSYIEHKKTRRLDHQMTEIYKSTFPGVKIVRDAYLEMEPKIIEARKKSVFHAQTGPHVRGIDILNNISKRIPKEIVVDITRLVIGPQNVLISGNTVGFDTVDDIKGRLEQIEFFKKVTISSANMDRSGKEVRFMLKAEF
jgi:type II secretion system protein L